MFHSWDDVLWVEHLSLLSPNIGNITKAKELYFVSSDQRTCFQYVFFFSRLSFKLGSSLEVSLLQKINFSWSQSHSPLLSRPLASVFVEISIPDLTKSFTSVLADVLGSLETRFVLQRFWNRSRRASVLHCVCLFKLLDNTSHSCSWNLKMLW